MIVWKNTSSIFSAVCLIVECEELLDSVQQDEGEQRTAEEQEALSDTLNTVSTLGNTLSIVIHEALLGIFSVVIHESLGDTVRNIILIALSDSLSTVIHEAVDEAWGDALGDTLIIITQVPLTAWDAFIIRICCGITNRFRDTAFYNRWPASPSSW